MSNNLLDELIEQIGQPVIDDFRFDYRWLSNFHVADIVYECLTYPSTEHAYQAAKSLDPEVRKRFSSEGYIDEFTGTRYVLTCAQAKREGQKIDIRPDWEQVKLQVMFDVCYYKFSHHPELKEKLLETYPRPLVEGNTWGDVYWGVCNGVGQNNLGKVLEVIRAELRAIRILNKE